MERSAISARGTLHPRACAGCWRAGVQIRAAALLLRSRSDRLWVASADHGARPRLHRRGAVADPAESERPGQDQSARRHEFGAPVAGRRTDGGLEAGIRPPSIARKLASEGWLSADAQPINTAKVRAIMMRMGLAQPQHPPSAEVERRGDEKTVPELSGILNLPIGTLYAWIRNDWLPARRVQTSYREILLVRLKDARHTIANRQEANCRSHEWKAPAPKRS